MENDISGKTLDILVKMDSISLEEMDHVKLMQRKDTKFVLPAEKVLEILNDVKDQYKVLEISGKRIHEYHTIYYDTPEFSMYHSHHNKRLNRYKVRVREYLTSGISFLEIKFKNNKRETIKKRIPPLKAELGSVKEADDFLKNNSPYSARDLEPSLQNFFSRITLVHKILPERITIDLGLQYENADGGKHLDLPNISVIEVKRSRDAVHSDMILSLQKHRIQKMGFSKYCIGTALTQPDVKINLFKNRLRELGKLEETFLTRR